MFLFNVVSLFNHEERRILNYMKAPLFKKKPYLDKSTKVSQTHKVRLKCLKCISISFYLNFNHIITNCNLFFWNVTILQS